MIAIVDAFDDPTAGYDLGVFSTQFGLPAADFAVVYANGIQPPRDPSGGWELEEALDIEWSHAMAPIAKIILVEAASDSLTDLAQAVLVASKLVASQGGGEISMSWGTREFASEKSFDRFFQTPGVVYFASAGDGPGVSYPSSSPNVISVGGTSLSRNPITGSLQRESAWQSGGGGPSAFESRPTYQDGVANIVGQMRGTPDLSFDADPHTGVWVFDSGSGQGRWRIVGGTSVASPSVAGIVNAASHFAESTAAELANIYQELGNVIDFRDIIYGSCGPYEGYLVAQGWDFCSGIGSSSSLSGK